MSPSLNLDEFGKVLEELSAVGFVHGTSLSGELLCELRLAELSSDLLIATDRLYEIAPARAERQIVRRVLALQPDFRRNVLFQVHEAISLHD